MTPARARSPMGKVPDGQSSTICIRLMSSERQAKRGGRAAAGWTASTNLPAPGPETGHQLGGGRSSLPAAPAPSKWTASLARNATLSTWLSRCRTAASTPGRRGRGRRGRHGPERRGGGERRQEGNLKWASLRIFDISNKCIAQEKEGISRKSLFLKEHKRTPRDELSAVCVRLDRGDVAVLMTHDCPIAKCNDVE